MLSYVISMTKMDPEEFARATPEARRAQLLGVWEIGVLGLDWLEDLVTAERAEKLADGGFPHRYVTRIRHLRHLFEGGGVPGVGPFSRLHHAELHPDRIDSSGDDEPVTVEAWDQS
ncbi:hypothetical protein AB0O91_40440 [Kitasatospora sp. NPDC089797]|uniref:hypothetical protein n=1 Tax=Kitasatospora sp. NPDC089797 TaxID=3155298 RepID=UPI00342404C4